MRIINLFISCSFVMMASTAACRAEIGPDQALSQLKAGNERYLKGKSIHPRFDPGERVKTATEGQKPICTILGCSDARVPPEVAFDQGFGSLFVVRVAGNVCSTAELASIEYGVKYVNTPLIVVLGHTKCGAVDGALSGAKLRGTLPKLMAIIAPAIEKTQADHPELKGAALSKAAVEANVRHSMSEILKNSPELGKRIKDGSLKLVGAIRDIETGVISWLK